MDKYVLVVDDDNDMRELLTQVAAALDMPVRQARDGAEALLQIRRCRPALILMDLCMPTMTGWDILDQLRSDNQLKRVPTLVVTTLPITQQLAASLRLPMACLLQKHGSMATLQDRVCSQFARYDALQRKTKPDDRSR